VGVELECAVAVCIALLRVPGNRHNSYNNNNNNNNNNKFDETTEHITCISTCPVLAKEKYTVWAELHFNMCREMGVKLDNERRYEHAPKLLETGHESKVTILWKKQVQTDRTFRKNKPDITICDNEKQTYMLIDFQQIEM